MQPDQNGYPEPASPADRVESLSFFARFFLAWAVWLRILVDGRYAARAKRLPVAGEPIGGAAAPKLPPIEAPEGPLMPAPTKVPPAVSPTPALQLLALFQREGRLVDFLEQDIATIPDMEVAAAARVVHEGCRRALRTHAEIVPIREEHEGAEIVLSDGFASAEIALSGDVRGPAPYRGRLRHHGWRAESLSLPIPVAGHDSRVIAPAEIEL